MLLVKDFPVFFHIKQDPLWSLLWMLLETIKIVYFGQTSCYCTVEKHIEDLKEKLHNEKGPES